MTAWDALIEAADRACIAALGTTSITYTSSDNQTVVVDGLFQASTVPINAGEAGATSTGPWIFVRLEDLSSDPDNDGPTITVGSQDYTVAKSDKDGLGGVKIHLHKAN